MNRVQNNDSLPANCQIQGNQFQQTNLEVGGNQRPKEVVESGVNILNNTKLLIVIGVSLLVLVLAGIAIGVSLALVPHYGCSKKAEISVNGGQMHVYSLDYTPGEDEPNYKVYATSVHPDSRRRALTQNDKQPEIHTHIVFNDFGIIITMYENSTFSVKVSPKATIQTLLQNDQAFKQLYNLYQNGTNQLTDEILLHLRSLFNQQFSGLKDQAINFIEQHFTRLILGSENKYLIQSFDTETHKRALWGFNFVPQISAISINSFSSALPKIKKAVQNAKDDIPQISGQSENVGSHHNCVPSGDDQIICEFSSSNSVVGLVGK